MEVWVLRLRHRLIRDSRITTHLMLVARAFGARGVFYSGRRDETLERRMGEFVEDWGGPFDVEYREDWKRVVREWKEGGGEAIHLTMYGLPMQDVIKSIRASKGDKLVVVGGAKVPGEVYKLVDWNVAVTSQPHSEVGALGVFLHEFFEGKELSRQFDNARLRVVPQERGKKIIDSERASSE